MQLHENKRQGQYFNLIMKQMNNSRNTWYYEALNYLQSFPGTSGWQSEIQKRKSS
jgi:hypothetical protein